MLETSMRQRRKKTIERRALELGGEIAKAAAVDLAGRAIASVLAALAALLAILIWTGGTVPAWALLVALLVVIAVACLLLRQQYGRAVESEGENDALLAELGRNEQYSGLLQDSLNELQQVISGDVGAEIDHYVEQAVLEPALRILTEKPAEDVRLSVLLPSGADPKRWSMRWSAGHTLAGRRKYDQEIATTMARHAFERREAQYWGDVEAQADFQQNPKASAPTRSLASTPIRKGEEVLGVLNAVSSERDAFDEAEQKFLLSLAAILAVAVSVWQEGAWPRGQTASTDGPASLAESRIEES